MTFSIKNFVIPFDDLNVHFCKNIVECNDIMCKKNVRV